jgi:hypothetical protein
VRNPDQDRAAALDQLAGIVYQWSLGRRPATDMEQWVRNHPDLVDVDPDGLRRAWIEEDPEPVPGVDYLPPAGDRWYTRDAEDADGPAHNRHLIGYSDVDGDHWYNALGEEVAA